MSSILQPQTKEGLLAQLQTQVPRWSPKLTTLFNAQFDTWIAELCQFKPIDFLNQMPRSYPQFPLAFPLPTLQVMSPTGAIVDSRFVSTGLLQLVPGVSKYYLYGPLRDDLEANAAFWAPVRVDQIMGCAIRDHYTGSRSYVLSPMTPLTRSHTSLQTPSNYGYPYTYDFVTTETGSYLEFFQTPTQYCLVELYFTLATCDSFQMQDPGTSTFHTYNRYLTYAPQIILYWCVAKAFEFFDETEMQSKALSWLFGVPNQGDLDSRKPIYKGQLGALQKKSMRQYNNMINEFRRYDSGADAGNRTCGGYSHRSSGNGSYYGRGVYSGW